MLVSLYCSTPYDDSIVQDRINTHISTDVQIVMSESFCSCPKIIQISSSFFFLVTVFSTLYLSGLGISHTPLEWQ